MLFILFFFSSEIAAQSPYLSFSATMDTSGFVHRRYMVEMKICQPKKMTESADYFNPDTSTINFMSLKSKDVECGNYAVNGEGIEVLAGDIGFAKYNEFTFSNQVFAWEKIIVLRISDFADTTSKKPRRMYLVLPVRYKAFVTFINIENIRFTEGAIIDASNAKSYYSGRTLKIELDLKSTEPVLTTSIDKTWL